MYFQRGKFHSNSDLVMRTRSGTEKKLEVSISDAAGKNLPEARLHLHFHARGMVDAQKQFKSAGTTKKTKPQLSISSN